MDIWKTLTRFISNNSPTILTGIGVAGVVGTAVLAVQASKKATRDIWDAESEFTEPLTRVEKIKLTWHHYIPPVIVGGTSIAAIIGAQQVNNKRAAALMSLYTLSNKNLGELQEKFKEVVGPEKYQEVKEEITKEHMLDAPMVNSEVIVTGNGDHLFFDTLSGRYFRSSINKVEKSEIEINRRCMNFQHASVNEFYELIGLPGVRFGDDQGWRVEHPLNIEINTMRSENDEPCFAIEYHGFPIRGYYKEAGR